MLVKNCVRRPRLQESEEIEPVQCDWQLAINYMMGFSKRSCGLHFRVNRATLL